MQDDDRLTPMEQELEAALGGLKPAGTALNRDYVMYQAGQTSARRRNHLWQGVSGVLVVLLVASMTWRPRPAGPQPRVETLAYGLSAAPVEVSSAEPIDRQQAEAFRHYIRMRQAVLNRGMEAIPVLPASHNGFDPTLSREDLSDLL